MLSEKLATSGPRPATPGRRTWILVVLVALAHITASLVTLARRGSPEGHLPIATTTQSSTIDPAAEAARRARIRSKLEKDLDWADRQQSGVIFDEVDAINAFFARATKDTPAFADDVMGFSSKWYLMSDRLPFTRTDRHAAFLRSKFDADLFSSDALTREINRSVTDFVDRSNDIENQMLVKMRLDVADLPLADLPDLASDRLIRAAFDRSILEAGKRGRVDLISGTGQLVTSIVLQQVLKVVATRMGVSAGILGIGAGSAEETLGISLVLSVVIDQVVSWVWDWWTDPRGNLAKAMDQQLDQMRRQILYGNTPGAGFCSALEEVAQKRSALRRQFLDRVTR